MREAEGTSRVYKNDIKISDKLYYDPNTKLFFHLCEENGEKAYIVGCPLCGFKPTDKEKFTMRIYKFNKKL